MRKHTDPSDATAGSAGDGQPRQRVSPGIRSVVRNTAYLLSGQGVQVGVRFLYAIILARVLGPHDYGLIGYGTSLYIAVLPLTKVGIEHVLVRVIGRDRPRGREMLQSALPLRKLTALFSTIVFALAVLFWEKDPQTRTILACFSIALLGRSFAQWNMSMFTAYESNRYSFRLQAIFRPLEVALGLLALTVWRNPLAIVLVHAATWWLEVVFGTWLLRTRFDIPRGRWNAADLKPILAESIPMCLAVTLVSAMSQGPLLVFKYLGGPGIAVGNLALAMQVFLILSQVSIAFSSASYPVLSRAIARGDGKETVFVESMMRFVIFFGGALALAGTALGPGLVPVVFGTKYAEAGFLMGTTLWMMIPWTAMNCLMRVQTARRKVHSNLAILAVGVLLFAVAAGPAVDVFGVRGSVLAAFAGMSVIAGALFIAVAKGGKMNAGIAVIRPLGVLILARASLHVLVPAGPWVSVFGAWAILVAAWFAIGCISRQEIALLIDVWRGRKNR